MPLRFRLLLGYFPDHDEALLPIGAEEKRIRLSMLLLAAVAIAVPFACVP